MIKDGTSRAQLLEQLLRQEGIETAERPAIQRRGQVAEIPLSFSQERFWFLNQLEAGAHYNDHLAWRLVGDLNVRALLPSLNSIIARHETLRTTFVSVEGRPTQHIDSAHAADLQYFDLTELSSERREAEALRHAAAEVKKPFELAERPAYRLALWKLAPDDHLFLLCIHQIINDGWSMRIFTKELTAIYQSVLKGESSDLPTLPFQYADFAIWQRDQFSQSACTVDMEYWKNELSGALPILELPLDQPRPSEKTFQGARHHFSIPDDLLQSLRSLAERENATPFMLLLAAFNTLIYRYTGQTDIAIGFPVANRTVEGTDRLIGVFINPLVLRSDLSSDITFAELLAQTRTKALDAYAHQSVPFEKLVDELQPNRNISFPPLFQVLFDYNNVPMPDLDLPGLSASRVELDAGTAKFDLSLELTEFKNEIRGFLEYSTEIFDATTIQRMARHFECLLKSIAADPKQLVSHLSLMSDDEAHKLLVRWNDTEVLREDVTIHDSFAEQAERTPDKTALIFGDRSQTYAELNRYADNISNLLVSSGIESGSTVGVFVHRSPELVGCLLGVLKAGCQYVPLDPHYPANRIAFMIEDADVSCLLTESGLTGLLPKSERQIFVIDDEATQPRARTVEFSQPVTTGDAAAYVIYTSGSTGEPKGVVGTHRGAMNRFEWMWDKYPFSADEVCCQKTSLGFVDSVWEIFGPLLKGVPSVIIPDDVTRDPDQFIQTLADHAITRLVAVPSLLEMLLARNEDLRHRLPSLRLCVSSGEAISPELTRRFKEALPDTILLNLYGSSEASADSTCYEVTADAARSTRPVPIGRPIDNTQVYILDRNENPVPTGVPGELHIGGAGLSRGYLNRPELNESRFMRDPFRSESRLFKTGDLGRYRPDGNIQILGRVDDQVKIRGMRVEPGEIEAKIKQLDSVREIAVVAREEPAGNRFLVAYVSSDDRTAVEAELRSYLPQVLPEHLVPAFFVFVDALPKTTSGKIDRRLLREGPEFKPRSTSEWIAPRNELEQKLSEIWETTLGLDSISVTSDFFELGGNSLVAVKLFYEIEKVLDRKVPLSTLFRAPSIEKLAALLQQSHSLTHESCLVSIQPKGSLPPFFCVHAAGGNVLFYRDLARRLGSEQPFYGIQARRIGGAQVAHSDVKDMASCYINEMRTVQPKGPYYFGGASFGGLVAVEIAQQLREQQEDVAFVALFDTRGPGYPRVLPGTTLLKSRVMSILSTLEHHRDSLRLLEPGTRSDYISARVKKLKHRLWRARRKYADIARTEGLKASARTWQDEMLGRTRFQPYAAPGVVPGDYRRTEGNIRRAFDNYVPRFYPGKVTLFRASKQGKGICPDPTLGWGPLIERLEIHEVEGHHGSIVAEPYVQFLAEKLNDALAAARKGTDRMHGERTHSAPSFKLSHARS